MKNVLRLISSILLCELAGMVGGIFTAQSVRIWYPDLQKPSFSPPNWVFAPVWITLYAMMGTSLYLVWKKRPENPGANTAIVLFMVQLLLNVAWSFLFFGLRSPLLGSVEIILLWIAIAATIVRFTRVSALSGVLLVPYLLWVSFAAVLTISIWQLNHGA
jgi:translocator protein